MSQPSRVAIPKQPPEPMEPRSLGYNLPVPSTRLVGRKEELAQVVDLLRRSDVRLVTLAGPPGIGKTRLGIQAAASLVDLFPGGTFFVPLAPISDPHLVIPTIAQAVGVKETAGRPLLQSVQSYLAGRNALLLLDNFEQVVAAGPELAELLEGCRGLKALVTSRELLHLYGEHGYPVPPLPVPALSASDRLTDLEALSKSDAVALFVQRAQAISPGFQLRAENTRTVSEICLRLDGLPLAIELAAARILVLPPEDLLARLESRLKLLTGGARNLPERQRTLRAAIDWSYNLLDEDEQVLFSRLGVFAGGCTLKAVEAVCGREAGMDVLDAVTSLISKSLLQQQEGAAGEGEPRFVMLETLREYARDKLEQGAGLDPVCERHCDYFLKLAESADQLMLGKETALWMRRLDAELNNLRAALEWTLASDGRAERGLRLAGALGRYWSTRGYYSEGRQWCLQLLSKAGAEQSMERAKALRTLAQMTYQLGNNAEARSIFEQSLQMSRSLGDDWGMATALLGLGSVTMWQGEYDFSQSLYEECLAIGRRLESRHLISGALSMIGVILMRKQQYLAAQPLMEESLALARGMGDKANIADTLIKRGSLATHLGEYGQAKALIEEGLGIARELGDDRLIAFSLARLGMIALRQGNPKGAEGFFLEGLARAQISGMRRWSQWYLVGLAEVARLGGMRERAAMLIGASDGEVSTVGAHYEPATSAEIERIVANVRAELDEETFAALAAEGRAMSLDEVVPHTSPSSKGASTPEGQQVSSGDLTEREVEVLRLIAVGKSNQEIGQELILSRRTVERHISNIYEKLGVSGKVARAAAAAYALRQGLTT